jgi:uncharacterized paraquat-inducible protein A
MTRLCQNCETVIPAPRLEAVPHTKTCVRCSREKAYIGFMDWHHKTAPELVLVNPENTESVRRARAVYTRRR